MALRKLQDKAPDHGQLRLALRKDDHRHTEGRTCRGASPVNRLPPRLAHRQGPTRKRRAASRAHEKRDITVPIRTLAIFAISAYSRSSNSRSTITSRSAGESARIAASVVARVTSRCNSAGGSDVLRSASSALTTNRPCICSCPSAQKSSARVRSNCRRARRSALARPAGLVAPRTGLSFARKGARRSVSAHRSDTKNRPSAPPQSSRRCIDAPSHNHLAGRATLGFQQYRFTCPDSVTSAARA